MLMKMFKKKLENLGMGVGGFIVEVSQIICILVLVYIGICVMFDLNKGKGFKKGYFIICMYIIIRLIGYGVFGL